jgi:hypothetical protein
VQSDWHQSAPSSGDEPASPAATGASFSSLDVLYWQDEILQVMFWLLGEGFAQETTIADLRRFLDGDPHVLGSTLQELEREGLVSWTDRAYTLTERGKVEAQRRFVDEFRPLLGKSGHGECDDDCWCHDPEHTGEPCPSTVHSHAGA